MAVKQVPQTWTASDGTEFDTQEQAERHDELVTARNAYEGASRKFGTLLAQRQKTADGEPFRLSVMKDYYYVSEPAYRKPHLVSLSFWFSYCHFAIENYGTGEESVVSIMCCEGNDPKNARTYRINELYASQRAAEKALLSKMEQWLEEQKEDVERLRSAAR